MNQRKTEWLDTSKNNSKLLKYHIRQFKQVNRSTVAFCDWLEQLRITNKSCSTVADIGGGMGANIAYMSKRFPYIDFTGIELNDHLVKTGNEYFKTHNVNTCVLKQGDIYHLDKSLVGKFDGLVSYQVLSWLPEYEIPLTKMIKLNPRWIAATSLFFDGDVNLTINVQDYTQPIAGKGFRETFYNIYSLALVKDLFKKHGYEYFKATRFNIDIDLKKRKLEVCAHTQKK